MKEKPDGKPQSANGGSMQRSVKRHLWHVVFDSVFESSHGMQGYSIPHKACEGHLVTATPDIGSVESEIQESLESQSRLTQLHKAMYLGTLLNAA